MTHQMFVRYGSNCRLAAMFIAALLLVSAGCDDERVTQAESDAQTAEQRSAVAADAETAEAQRAGFTQDPQAARGVQEAQSETQGLEITKRLPEQIRLGTPFTYTIAVKASEEINGVIVREELPQGFVFEKSEPQAQVSQDGRVLTFQLGNLQSNSEQAIQITGAAQQVGKMQACTTYEIDRGVCTEFAVLNPQLRLSKQGPEQASICEPVTYTYVIKNEGETPAENVIIYDSLAEGLKVVDGGDEVKVEVGTLQPGQEVTHQAQVIAEDPNQNAASYAYARSNLDEVRSQVVQTQFLAPNLAVQANAIRPFEYAGKTAHFNVTVQNTGNAAIHQAHVRLDIDGNGELASINGQPIGEARLARASDNQQQATAITEDGVRLGALKPGARQNFTVEVNTEDTGRVQLVAQAVALCPQTEKELAQVRDAAAVEIRPLSALQLEVVDKTDPVRVGEETIYEVTVLNEGSADEPNLQVTAQLPQGLSLVGVEGPSEAQLDGQNLTFNTIERLPAGETATWYVRVRAEQPAGNTKFTVTAKSETVGAVSASEPTRLY